MNQLGLFSGRHQIQNNNRSDVKQTQDVPVTATSFVGRYVAGPHTKKVARYEY